MWNNRPAVELNYGMGSFAQEYQVRPVRCPPPSAAARRRPPPPAAAAAAASAGAASAAAAARRRRVRASDQQRHGLLQASEGTVHFPLPRAAQRPVQEQRPRAPLASALKRLRTKSNACTASTRGPQRSQHPRRLLPAAAARREPGKQRRIDLRACARGAWALRARPRLQRRGRPWANLGTRRAAPAAEVREDPGEVALRRALRHDLQRRTISPGGGHPPR